MWCFNCQTEVQPSDSSSGAGTDDVASPSRPKVILTFYYTELFDKLEPICQKIHTFLLFCLWLFRPLSILEFLVTFYGVGVDIFWGFTLHCVFIYLFGETVTCTYCLLVLCSHFIRQSFFWLEESTRLSWIVWCITLDNTTRTKLIWNPLNTQ